MTTSQVFIQNNGFVMPRLGFGTFKSPRDTVRNAVLQAAKTGYRHIDCAAIYENEAEIGEAFEEMFTKLGYKREEFYITSKLWHVDHRPERVKVACEKTLKDLRLTYLDLYLIHKPLAFVPGEGNFPKDGNGKFKIDKVPVEATWRAMEELVALKLVKSIGTSTFPIGILHNLLMGCTIKPACNQVELHPFLHEDDLIEYCAAEGIIVTAFSPLAKAGESTNPSINILKNETLLKIATKHKKTPAQIALRWNLQRAPNIGVLPKSVTPARIAENFQVYDFSLDGEDMTEIATLNRQYRFSRPKVQFGVGFLGDEHYLDTI